MTCSYARCLGLICGMLLVLNSGAVAGEPVPTAHLITEDTKTKGDWQMAYGADGGEVFGDKAFYPKYAQVVKAGQFFQWSPDSEEDSALNKKDSEERIAACFSERQMTLELFLKEGEHRTAIYFNDYDKKGRREKVEILDGRNNAVLVSRAVADFQDGKYLVYDLSGHLKVRLTAEQGENCVVSGIFFGKNARNGPRKARSAGEMPTAAGFHKRKFYATVGGKKILVPYIFYVPEGYDKTQEKYPVIVHLHGAGEGGTDLNGIFNTGLPADFKNNEALRKAVKAVGFWPQSVMDWTPPMTTATIQALDDFLEKARVDKDRVYCTGYSMGGKGTWFLAEEAAPRFAAIAPMDPFAVQPEVAQKTLKDTSIWIIVGAQDGDHTLGSREMFKKMKEVNADVYLTVVPNTGHGAWYRFMPDPIFYDWLLKHKRGMKERIELPSIGIIEDPVEKFKKQALKTPPNNGGEGSILCRFWRGIEGSSVGDLTRSEDFPDFPSEIYYMTKFEIPADLDDNYGTMLNGYIVPPESGEYTFWVSSDDDGELWLSDSDKEEGRKLIAKCAPYTTFGNWDAFPTQKSAKIKLEKGKRYYVEALHKEGSGQDFVMAGWQLPSGAMERPIPGNRLVPYVPRKRGPPQPPQVTLLDDVTKYQKPGMHKLKAVIQFERQKVEMSYCLYLPKDYDAKRPEGFPMFTFLHGNGHQGSDWNGLLNEGPPQMLTADAKLRDKMTLAGFFPQCPADKRWDNRAVIQATVALLAEVEKHFNIDKDRVYCTGLSMGGMGTWFVAQEAPWLFAAIAPISAVAVRIEVAPKRLKDVPTWIICGSDDGGFTDGSLKMFEAFKENGNVVKLDKIQGEGHGVWGRYYPTMPFYEWLLQYKRKPRAPVAVPVAAVVAAVAPVVTPPVPAPVTPPVVAPVVAPPVVAVVPPKVPTPAVVPPPVQPVTSVVAQVQKPAEGAGAKVTAQEVAVIPPKAIAPAPVVPAALVIAPPHLAPSAPYQPRVPYGQIMLLLSGLLFVLAFYFLIGNDKEGKGRAVRG